jgi:hypothetical protein
LDRCALPRRVCWDWEKAGSIECVYAHAGIVRCNVSSWFVEPQFRSHATFLVSKVLNQKDVTFLNISPTSHVRPIIEAQGFTRYSSGQFVTLSGIRRVTHDCRSIKFALGSPPEAHFEQFERELLLAHAEYGCLSLW